MTAVLDAAAPARPLAAVPALRLRGLFRAFGATPVLAGVDLDVPQGGVVALVGPSGCGKTTLVRLVAGFDAPDAGVIALAGREVVGPRGTVVPERRRVGVVPQEGALFSHLDVAGNVGFGLARRGRTGEGRTRVAHLLDLVDLAGLGGRRPDQLSGGQQQRVAVARALAPAPDLVLLDEPFSALDASLRVSVRDAVMAALRAEAASVLLVTHDQDEALGVADLVAVMLDGRIAQVGTPADVYARPVSAAVARFLGEAVLLPGLADGVVVRCALGILPLASPAHGSVTVLLRPEQLALAPSDGSTPSAGPVAGPVATTDAATDAAIAAVQAGVPVHAGVEAVAFHGHDALVSLRAADGLPLQARSLAGWLPRPGDRVAVRVRGSAWPLPA
jgi:iron(III) transport system ATP-binding protein